MTNKRYFVGERFTGPPVDTWGRFADTAEREHDLVPGDRAIQERSHARVRVYNDTGEDIPPGGVVRLGDAKTDPNDQESIQFMMPTILGEMPAINSPFGIAIGNIRSEQFDQQEPPVIIPDSAGVGRVAINGACWARVDITNASHVSAGIEDDTVDHLVTPGNTPILWKPSGLGVKLCLVNLGPSTWIRRVTISEPGGIIAGGSGEVTYEPFADGLTDTAHYDWVGSGSGETISEGLLGFVSNFHEDGKVRILEVDCEPEPSPAPPGHGDNISAAGIIQGDATGISYRVNRVDTISPGSAEGVMLPQAFEQGEDCFVQNNHASATLTIYPFFGDSIDDNAVNIPVTLAAGGSAHFFHVQVDKWVT